MVFVCLVGWLFFVLPFVFYLLNFVFCCCFAWGGGEGGIFVNICISVQIIMSHCICICMSLGPCFSLFLSECFYQSPAILSLVVFVYMYVSSSMFPLCLSL